ncbi:hypothetical protein MKW92_036335 [Papaver armeniacum]|nr:hypothetical protein MKW92_036335 [Papaver armeniacum]
MEPNWFFTAFVTDTIHKEQIEKWPDEIKKLRSLDAINEESNTHLHMTLSLFRDVHI